MYFFTINSLLHIAHKETVVLFLGVSLVWVAKKAFHIF